MTIAIGNAQFTGPHFLTACPTGNSSGLYAIMIKPDPVSKPDDYTLIYIGETSNFEERLTTSHHRYDCWKRQAGSEDKIFYGLHVMKSSTEAQRLDLESDLIQQHDPICNKQ
ncbi:MAG: GIY-YIG nuclease family protein [Nitrosotalea sp.]